MLNHIKIKLQYWLPKTIITNLFGWFANKKAGWLTQFIIKIFVKYYNIDIKSAKDQNFSSYLTFNDFFMRSLHETARPIINSSNWLSLPVDGKINQIGLIYDDQIFQAKGHYYSLESLLAGNIILSESFRNGLFSAIYLSPSDYHRVHMPCSGILREMIYVPGDLFSVNFFTTSNIPNIFARNERIICIFDTAIGLMIQILIGATIVGSIETIWSGTITPPRNGIIKRFTYPSVGENGVITLKKGAEMGRFKLGSTVINLFVSGSIQFSSQLKNGSITRVGEAFAEILTIPSIPTNIS